MECDRCGDPAVVHAAYAGAHWCGPHLRAAVDKRVRRRIRADGLIPQDATPEDPQTWMIGLSGGKDSAVLTHILSDTLGDDPRIELVAVTIHEGISGYRDASLVAARELAAARTIRHEEYTYAEEFGVEMDDVAVEDPLSMAPCAYCGVFRRNLLDRAAAAVDADLILTGHNLDDEAETALMNIVEGNVDQVAKHYDASLGPLPQRRTHPQFVPRAKPLREIPEQEVALYAHTLDLPVHSATCPHSSESFRAEIQDHMLALEDAHPGTRHSIMAGYLELAAMAADSGDDAPAEPLSSCTDCGAPTQRERCRACELQLALDSA
ncbi:UNVERIFIED_CONTAM: TIGR00269 family protein [Euhalothece sp. KZN 001]